MAAKQQFHWIRKGRVFCPDGRYEWMQTHAQVPVALALPDRLRVYFNCRAKKDAQGQAQAYPTFLDLDLNDPTKILNVHDRPILNLGDLGTFDQFGIMTCSIVPVKDEMYMYYNGWSRTGGVPYGNAIGVAISKDSGTNFTRYARGPIMTRTPDEPFIQNSPFAIKIDGMFHMWYGTGLDWKQQGNAIESHYVLVHATSEDGIHWQRDGKPCLPAILEHECQTNATVIRRGERFHMWFSYRYGVNFRNADRGYRIGYAWSADLKTWHRDDAAGELLPAMEQGWDSQMACYPYVIELGGKLHMFYCGNDFGREGFGLAIAEE